MEEKKDQAQEVWSAISPGDLGLKAGYWTEKDSDPLTFKPIVGWITVLSREPPFTDSNPPKNGFYPVVLADPLFSGLMWPIVASNLPSYCGVFPKKMTERKAKALALEWTKKSGSTELQPNMGRTGQA
jgi:hypothetical protein